MLKEKLLEDLKDAMKTKNVNKKNAIQMVRTAILQIEKDKGIEVSDEQILGIVAKEVKTRSDSLSDFEKGGREDLVAQAKEEISILSEYLPKQLSIEEIETIVKDVIRQTGATKMKDMGIVMKTSKEKMGATADGKTISDTVKRLLS